MWKRGEIAPKEQFLLFSTLFYIYISNFRSQIIESLGLRDNESRLYFVSGEQVAEQTERIFGTMSVVM